MSQAICPTHFCSPNPKTNQIPPRVNCPTTISCHLSRTVRPPLRLQASSANTNHSAAPPPSPKLIPQVRPGNGGLWLPPVGLGTYSYPPASAETIKAALVEAIKLGYRRFDTSPKYLSEKPLGDAIRESVAAGVISSREEIFITSKLWVSEAHSDLVVPALRSTLRDLQTDYVDAYLIHWPVRMTAGKLEFPNDKDFLPFEIKGVWPAMEECHELGLTKAIGVCNYTQTKLEEIFSFAKIPPVVNQVEVSPLWKQKELINYCKTNGILVSACCILGSPETFYGSKRIFESQILKDIAKAKGKTLPQVCLRWVYEQGIVMIVKSFNVERMKENIDIFDWELTPEEHQKINQIPQSRGIHGWPYISSKGYIKTLHQMWDGEL